MALVNAPFTWPNSVDSSRSGGSEPLFTGTNMIDARRIGVDGLGDQFFAGAGFAGDQNRRAAGRHLPHQVEHAQHALALADDVGEAVALLERALELRVLVMQPLPAITRSISISSFSLSQGLAR